MGGKFSADSVALNKPAGRRLHGPGCEGIQPQDFKQPNIPTKVTPSGMTENKVKDPISISEQENYEIYDGIPRFPEHLAQKSTSFSASKAKVSEVSARLGRAGSIGIEKAVKVLDTLGSSVSNLHTGSPFVSRTTSKGNELSILGFEVANTIMKGSLLMQSLSKRSIRFLEEVVFASEGVQNLVSKDGDELLRLFYADKREELNIFREEVVRFGNRCKDTQWHNLDRYFEKQSRQLTSQNWSQEEVESVMLQMMNLVQCTAELYLELQILSKTEQRHRDARILNSNLRGDELYSLSSELKTRRKLVKQLKKKSLWSRSMEEVMEKLVDIVVYLNQEMQPLGSANDVASTGSEIIQKSLGSTGLALHYANIVLQIDSIVDRSSPVPSILKDVLYRSLPPNIKLSFRSKLHSFHAEEELEITGIKVELEKILCWLVPMAANTAKAHYGFGWVGEWAKTGSQVNRKSSGKDETISKIETLHYANKGMTEEYIVELLLWLNHLINKCNIDANGGGTKSTERPATDTSSIQQPSLKGMPSENVVKD